MTWASFNLPPLIVAMVLEKYAWCTNRLLEQRPVLVFFFRD